MTPVVNSRQSAGRRLRRAWGQFAGLSLNFSAAFASPAVSLRRDEMKDKSGCDTCRDGDDSTPPPIRENAQGKHHQDSQYDDLGNDQSHGALLPCEAFGAAITRICAARDA